MAVAESAFKATCADSAEYKLGGTSKCGTALS